MSDWTEPKSMSKAQKCCGREHPQPNCNCCACCEARERGLAMHGQDDTDKATPILDRHPQFERRENYGGCQQTIHWVHEHGHTQVAVVHVADEARFGEARAIEQADAALALAKGE